MSSCWSCPCGVAQSGVPFLPVGGLEISGALVLEELSLFSIVVELVLMMWVLQLAGLSLSMVLELFSVLQVTPLAGVAPLEPFSLEQVPSVTQVMTLVNQRREAVFHSAGAGILGEDRDLSGRGLGSLSSAVQ